MFKKILFVFLLSLLVSMSFNSGVTACNKHMSYNQYLEACRRANINNPLIVMIRWRLYLKENCDEYKPNPSRRGWIAPWGARYCPRCGAKGEKIGDYDNYGIQVVYGCEYDGCGFKWLVRTDQ